MKHPALITSRIVKEVMGEWAFNDMMQEYQRIVRSNREKGKSYFLHKGNKYRESLKKD